MWRDELNAFAITWDSPTLSSLFHHLHYEAHPWLWYVILWVLSRFTVSITAFKLLQGVIGTAILLLIALRSPFRTGEKALILASYFVSFEYTVLARMYGVVLLLLLLYCWQRVNRPNNPIGSAVLLGLIASTDSIGILLSLALLLEYAAAVYFQRDTRFSISRRAGALAVGVYCAITAFAVWSMRTAPDISWRTTGRIFRDAGSLSHLFDSFASYTIFAFWSVKSPRSGFFWDPSVQRPALSFVLILIILAALYFAVRPQPNLLLLVFSAVAAGTLFGHLIYMGSVRHFGMVFMAFLAAIWIWRRSYPAQRLRASAYFLLAVSALSGVVAAVGQWRHPFSNAEATANWIRANHLQTMPLVGEIDSSVVGVAENLHRPIYMIECSCVDTYLLFSARRDNFTQADAPQRILQAEAYYHGQPLLFVDANPNGITPSEQAAIEALGLRIQPLKSFTGAEEIAENFYLYRITPSPHVSASSTIASQASDISQGALHAQ